jgi:hypothetical protein
MGTDSSTYKKAIPMPVKCEYWENDSIKIRVFDFSRHSDREEFQRFASWAMRNMLQVRMERVA